MYIVIGNVYRGEGFVWVEEQGTIVDLWKYSTHGIYSTYSEAVDAAEQLNKKLK